MILVQRTVTKKCAAYEKIKWLMWPTMPIPPRPTLATINRETDCCLRLVRSTYHGYRPWCVVLMFGPISLPRVSHDILGEGVNFNFNFNFQFQFLIFIFNFIFQFQCSMSIFNFNFNFQFLACENFKQSSKNVLPESSHI